MNSQTEMESKCRLCAETLNIKIPILQHAEFCSKTFQLFQIRICPGDGFPTHVCDGCFDMVEKTWTFNDKIQKAQEILTDLVILNTNVDNVQSNGECTSSSSLEDKDSLMNNVLDESHYVDAKEIVKCDFLSSEDPLSDNSMEQKKRNVRTKSKTRKCQKKKKEKLEGVEYDLNEDGSITPKTTLMSWDSYPWTCYACHEPFRLCQDLKKHNAANHDSVMHYICVDCPKVYSKYSMFLGHIKLHRPYLKFSCDICFKWFLTAEDQEQHRTNHGKHVCPTCGKLFKMQSILQVHIRSHLPADVKNCFQCDQCPKKFSSKPNLMAHKRIHIGIREHTCKQCGKSFIQKGNLDNHMVTHTVVRPYTCNLCGKTFKTLLRLRKHSSVHSGLKPHQCEVCGRQFREKGTLKEHLRIHTGAMPFTCEFCGKCFRFKGVLTTHRRQHTGERPYSCNECQHHFTNWPNYNKHMKRRHGINTSVTCRTRQDIPPTGMPHRNPPGTVLAPPQPVVVSENFVEQPTFYPVLSFCNVSEDLLQQRM